MVVFRVLFGGMHSLPDIKHTDTQKRSVTLERLETKIKQTFLFLTVFARVKIFCFRNKSSLSSFTALRLNCSGLITQLKNKRFITATHRVTLSVVHKDKIVRMQYTGVSHANKNVLNASLMFFLF